MVIDEKSRVSLFAVLSAIPFIVGGMIWLTTIDAKATTSQAELKGVREMLQDVRERVIRIEVQVKEKEPKPRRGYGTD